MRQAPLRIVKLGGSLLTFPRLRARLRAWLKQQPLGHTVLVVGGGPIVDGFRELYRQQPISETAVHWLCIQALSLTSIYFSELLPEAERVDDFVSLKQRIKAPGETLFDVLHFMREVEPRQPGTCLPSTWDVTSDSIAARLAVVLGADELVLLKSASADAASSLADLSAGGYVDRFLPHLARELPTWRLVNLRAAI